MEEFSCKGHGSTEILVRKKKKPLTTKPKHNKKLQNKQAKKTPQQNYAYQAAAFRRPDKHAGSLTTACGLPQRWVRGVVGLARVGDLFIGLYNKKLAFSWLTEKNQIDFIYIRNMENSVVQRYPS